MEVVCKRENKICSTCKKDRTIDEFRFKKDGIKENRCIHCEREKSLKNYYRIKQENPEKLSSRVKDYKQKNKVTIQKKSKEWKNKNREAVSLYRKQYYENNKEQINKKHSIYLKQKYKTDINHRLKQNLRNRIYSILKNNKNNSTSQFLGCSIEYFKKHIESKFVEDMSWNNYGDWHIDHIKPCASFDLTNPEEQKKCFHYTNLQPLWALDNLKKGDKYEN